MLIHIVYFDGENKLTFYCYRKNWGSLLKTTPGLHQAEQTYLLGHLKPNIELQVSVDAPAPFFFGFFSLLALESTANLFISAEPLRRERSC